MPDVDRFARTLRGQHWRKAYRLSFSDANELVLRDTITRACAARLRKAFPAGCVRQCPQIIFKCLMDNKKQTPRDGYAVFLELTKELEQFDSEKHDFASVEIIKKVALSVFADLEARKGAVTPTEVENCFSKELIERLIRHDFLAPVRERIASKRNHSPERQINWENKVIADVTARGVSMFKSFFKKNGAIRAPRRATRQRRMTIDELNKGLNVMEP